MGGSGGVWVCKRGIHNPQPNTAPPTQLFLPPARLPAPACREDDMAPLVVELQPARWKVFQVGCGAATSEPGLGSACCGVLNLLEVRPVCKCRQMQTEAVTPPPHLRFRRCCPWRGRTTALWTHC